MSNLSNAVEQVLALAAQQQGIIDLANALKSIASIDNATDEAKARLATAKADEAAATADLASINDQISYAAEKRDNLLAQAQSAADSIIAAAKADAKELSDNAVAAAGDSASAAKALADQIKATATAEAQDAINQAAKATAEAAAADELVQAANQELADLQTKIAAAKAQIAKMLG